MGKILITLSPAQETWLRAEAERQDLPGGLSELVRRLIDTVREKETGMQGPSIPDDVLEKIVAHRPHMAAIAENLRAHPQQARQIEKALATAYLQGATKLTALETWRLAACSAGRPYGS